MMSTDSIEKLYKNFGILADAKDKLVQVRLTSGMITSWNAGHSVKNTYTVELLPLTGAYLNAENARGKSRVRLSARRTIRILRIGFSFLYIPTIIIFHYEDLMLQ